MYVLPSVGLRGFIGFSIDTCCNVMEFVGPICILVKHYCTKSPPNMMECNRCMLHLLSESSTTVASGNKTLPDKSCLIPLKASPNPAYASSWPQTLTKSRKLVCCADTHNEATQILIAITGSRSTHTLNNQCTFCSS